MTMKRLAAFVVVGWLGSAVGVSAQWVVNDPALTAKSVIQRMYAAHMQQVMDHTYEIIRRMARRFFGFFESADRYVPRHVPLWRTWRQDDPTPEALAFMDALNAGVGTQVHAVAPWRPDIDPEGALTPAVRRALALLDVADSALVVGVDQTGRIREARKSEREAVANLERAVTMGTGSTTARLEVINAGVMIGARQRQSRLELAASIVEQLAVEAVQARQAAVDTMRMRQTGLEPPVNVLRGSGADLARWRQP